MKVSISILSLFLLTATASAITTEEEMLLRMNQQHEVRNLKKERPRYYYRPEYPGHAGSPVPQHHPAPTHPRPAPTHPRPAPTHPAPAPTYAKPQEPLQSLCPSAIRLVHPGTGRIGDKCLSGAACQTRFDPMRDGTDNLVGSDILSVKGQQQGYLAKHGLASFITKSSISALLDKIYVDAIMKCLTRGPAAIHYDFSLNTVPFQPELVELCQCILSGGIQCDSACGCYKGHATPPLPFAIPFCDCYCACCH